MDRRQFLSSAGAISASALLAAKTAPADTAATTPAGKPFGLDSLPVLQCSTPDGVTVVWAVIGPSMGWVDYGPTEALGQQASSAHRGLINYEPRFHSVRLSGLTPGKPIFYRVCAAPIHFASAYKITRGEPAVSQVFRYTPPDPAAARSSFAVINDTHEREPTLKALTDRLAIDPADLTVWNGDVFNDIRSDDQIVRNVLRPAGAGYASERPVLFTAGNHDHRGVAARLLPKAFAPWPQEPALPWCFAVRNGPVALIGLDTGEDKPDRHPAWAGLAAFEPYRRLQRDWLASALKRPDIAGAPHLVVCCHIPLNGPPGANGGDTLEGFADYCKDARDLWGPLLAPAGVQLVISGHTHSHRYDDPTPDRPYGQLVGGGRDLGRATLIRGVADRQQLLITATNHQGRVLGEWRYAPRKV